MSFKGVNINKGQGNLGRRNPSGDSIMALIMPVVEIADKLEYNNAYELLQLSDAEAMGINEAYDANNEIPLHLRISEFFRIAPDGKLFLLAVDDEVTGNDADVKAMIKANPSIKYIAFDLPATDIDDLTGAKIAAVQQMVADLAAEKIYIDGVILDGKGFATATAIAAYPDLRTEAAPNVQVCIAKDPIVDTLTGVTYKGAAIGAALGAVAVRKVNENMGSVDIINKPDARKGEENYSLTSVADSRFLTATLTDGTSVSSLSQADQSALTAKGYIFAGSFPAYGGIFFNGDPTCVELASDYAYGNNNRVWNKAARGIYLAGIPSVRGVLKKNEDGTLRPTTITALKTKLEVPLNAMLSDEEISGFDTYIDPSQTPDDETPLVVKVRILKDGILHEMTIDLGLTNTL